MDDLQSVSAALAALGYGPTSAPVFASRALHHTAQLLYEAGNGELLVTVLVGKRSGQTSFILYLCDCVQRSLGHSGWGSVSTGVKMLFLSFLAALTSSRAAPLPGARKPGSSTSANAATQIYATQRGGVGGAGARGGAAANESSPRGDCTLNTPEGTDRSSRGAAGFGGPMAGGALPLSEDAAVDADELPPLPSGLPTSSKVGARRPGLADAMSSQRHALPEIPALLQLPEMVGNDYEHAEEGASQPDCVEISIPADLCGSVLASLRCNSRKDQQVVRNWSMVLKQSTTTLLGRLPSTAVRSRRAPPYRALTHQAVVNAKITLGDGAVQHTVETPIMGNTSGTLVTPTRAIILFMAGKGEPLYLWLIDQFKSGVVVESGRKRKAPPASSTAGADPPAGRRRLDNGTGDGPGEAGESGAPATDGGPAANGAAAERGASGTSVRQRPVVLQRIAMGQRPARRRQTVVRRQAVYRRLVVVTRRAVGR